MGSLLREYRAKWLAEALDAYGVSWLVYRYEFTLVRGAKSMVIVATGTDDPAKAYRCGSDLFGRADLSDRIRDRLAG